MYYGSLRLDSKQELYWARIAAENGDDSGFMYGYAVLLNSRPGVDSNERARVQFWLRKAASLGSKEAQQALKSK